jgi:hypothetical protein
MDDDQFSSFDRRGELETDKGTATMIVSVLCNLSEVNSCAGAYKDCKNGSGGGKSLVPTTEVFRDAGQSLGDAVQPGQLPNSLEPWLPFTSGYDFNLASWFISSGTPHSRINEFFNSGLQGETRSSFTSAYMLHKIIKTMDADMGQSSWTKGEVRYWSGSSEFWYRDPITIVQFLLRQRTFVDELVYAPTRVFDADGQRLFTEMHTGNWWWSTQVSWR